MSLCVVQPYTWPEDLQEWGKAVARTTPWVDPFPQPPAGYFGNSYNGRYYLQEAVKAARRYWG